MDPIVHFNGTCKFLLQQRRAVAAALAVLTFSGIGNYENIDS
jgi:hypothetical protein